jgi:hypothetical protein
MPSGGGGGSGGDGGGGGGGGGEGYGGHAQGGGGEGLWAVVFPLSKSGREVFMATRPDGQYMTFGGTPGSGETPPETASREFRDKGGVVPGGVLDLTGWTERMVKDQYGSTAYFIGRAPNRTTWKYNQNNSKETTGGVWLTLDDLIAANAEGRLRFGEHVLNIAKQVMPTPQYQQQQQRHPQYQQQQQQQPPQYQQQPHPQYQRFSARGVLLGSRRGRSELPVAAGQYQQQQSTDAAAGCETFDFRDQLQDRIPVKLTTNPYEATARLETIVDPKGLTNVGARLHAEMKKAGQPRSIATVVAGNSGRPAGACGFKDGTIRKLHPEHTTQEEDVVSNWMTTACHNKGRPLMPGMADGGHETANAVYQATIFKKWGMLDLEGSSKKTVQHVSARAHVPPKGPNPPSWQAATAVAAAAAACTQ